VNKSHFSVRVYAEDTDYGGIVYHANHLKYLERARTEWLRDLGYEQDNCLAEGYLFIVTAVDIKYRHPIKFNDILWVRTGILRKGRASLVFEQTIEKQGSPQVLSTAEVKVACVNLEFRPCALPILIE